MWEGQEKKRTGPSEVEQLVRQQLMNPWQGMHTQERAVRLHADALLEVAGGGAARQVELALPQEQDPGHDGTGSARESEPLSQQSTVMAATAIAALPTFTWQPAAGGHQCAICKEDFEHGCRVTGMPCGHLFHGFCLQPWLRQRHTCPMCRFPLQTASPVREHPALPLEGADRVRPASSAPAREGARRRHAHPDASPSSRRADLQASAPVLWTSMHGYHRRSSAANPATWSLQKLKGVLSEANESFAHCQDRSSLIEMVVLCVHDYASAGARFDLREGLHLQTTDDEGGVECQNPREPNGGSTTVRHDIADEDQKDRLLNLTGGQSGEEPPRQNSSLRGDPVCLQSSAARLELQLSLCRVKQPGVRAGAPGAVRRREAVRELLELARRGDVAQMHGQMLMASAAQATQKHAARINHAHRLARSQEQQRAHEAEEAHHILFARERQRADARAESGDGPASDPSEFSCAGRAAGGVTVRGCSTGGAAAGGSVRDRDFGWSGAAGRRCAQGGTGGPRAGGKTCMSIQRCAQGGEGEAVEGVTRCPLVKKVAVGKDPTLFE